MKYFFLCFFICFSFITSAQVKIELASIGSHIGDSVTVEGKVFGSRFLESANNTPTFINIGAAFPNQLLTVVIWGHTRPRLGFDPSDKKYIGGMAKVTGKVELYKGKPQIVVTDPAQLVLLSAEETKSKDNP